jgi:hypothetical protein
MQHCLRTEGLCFSDSGSERLAVVVAVGDDADFQIPPLD